MASSNGKQILTIHILPNISRTKGNQTMKFGQLIEINVKNIFLEKLYIKYDGKIIHRSVFKKIKI